MCSLECGFSRLGMIFRELDSLTLVAYEEEVEDRNLG